MFPRSKEPISHANCTVAMKDDRRSHTPQMPHKIADVMPDHIQFGFQALILVSRCRRRLRARRRHHYWVHPITMPEWEGVHLTFFFPNYPDKFLNLWMSVTSFDDLLQRVSHHIERQDTIFSQSISLAELLMLTMK